MIAFPRIRVLLIHPIVSLTRSTSNVARSKNDIIISYNPDYGFKAITAIWGHITNSQQHKVQLFSTGIRMDELRQEFGHNHRILDIETPDTEFLLSDDEWQTLRKIIIDRNPELTSLIGELEALQQLLPELVDESAKVFEALTTAISIFDPKNVGRILEYMNRFRDSRQQSKQLFGESILASLIQNDLANTITDRRSASSFVGRMVDAYRANSREDDAIQRDFDNPGDGLVGNSGALPPDMVRKMAVLSDTGSSRTLTLFLAHRAASKQRDIAASDLIYVNERDLLVIFVQYKSIKDLTSSESRRLNVGQIEILLNICKLSDATCVSCFPDRQANFVRLANCPVFYKLLKKDYRISPKSKSMEGVFLQACLVEALREGDAHSRHQISTRSIPHGLFIDLVRRSQIGSRPESYNALTEVMLAHMEGVVAVER